MRWLGVVTVTVLAGCSSLPNPFGGLFSGGDDTSDPPAELVPLENPIPLTTLWTMDVGAGTGGQRLNLRVAFGSNQIYAADHKGRVMALDSTNGRSIWRTATRIRIAAGPAEGEGYVVVGGGDGELIALDAESGAMRWRVQLSSEVLSVPRVAARMVFVHTVDGKLWGLSVVDGVRVWLQDRQVPALTLRGVGTAAIDGGTLFAGFANGKLVASSLRDGRQLWETAIATPHGRSELARLVDIDGEMVIRDGIVYVGSFQGRVAAVSADTGVILWRRDISSYAGLSVDASQLYISDAGGHIWALDRATGAANWKQEGLFERALTAPAILGDHVVVGDFEGYLHWLRRDDGAIVGRHRIAKAPITTVPVVVGKTLYAFSDAGTVAALRTGT